MKEVEVKKQVSVSSKKKINELQEKGLGILKIILFVDQQPSFYVHDI